jgi:isopenicillin-N epimerase
MRRRFLKQAAVAGAGLLGAQRAFAEQLARLDLPQQAGGDFRRLRSEYLLDKNVTYLNHGSIGTVPRVIHEAHTRYLKVCESNPWLYMWSDGWAEALDEARKRAAWQLRCATDEVAFTHNTTEAFNLLAHGLPLAPGDEILFSTLNHPTASGPWHHMAAQRGFVVKQFDFPISQVPLLTPARIVEIYAEQVTPRTRVLVFPHIDNTVGVRYPVAAMVRMAREKGIEFVAVDGAQAIGTISVDVPATGVEVYATSPHKWLQAPKGTGLLYVRKDVQEKLRPMWVSSSRRPAGSARSYEDYNTRDIAIVLALGDAIAFQAQFPPDAREARLRELWAFTRAQADKAGVTWRSPNDWEVSSAVMAVDSPGLDSRELEKRLYHEHGVVTRGFRTLGLNSVRLTPNVFTREEEIARYFEVAAKIGRQAR